MNDGVLPERWPSPRTVFFSAYSSNLRAAAQIRFFQETGHQVDLPRSHGPPGSVLELACTFLPNCWKALNCRAGLAIGFKPHLNVTLPLLICKLRGISTWIDVDDLDHAYREGFLSHLIQWTQKFFPRLFSLVSYHNPILEKYLIKEMGCTTKQLLRVPQGVPYEIFSQTAGESQKETLQNQYRLKNKRIAIYTAHLNVASDLEYIFSAWHRVVKQLPESLLFVVGGGPRLHEFQNLVKASDLDGHVIFTGEVPHSEMAGHLALANVALLYFSPRNVNRYRCSLKLREYLAAGIRVVCNNFGELAEFEKFTYQSSSSIEDYADTIVRILQGHSDFREQRAQTFTKKNLDWKIIFLKTLEEVMERQLLKRDL